MVYAVNFLGGHIEENFNLCGDKTCDGGNNVNEPINAPTNFENVFTKCFDNPNFFVSQE
jgi:hypothetical protein